MATAKHNAADESAALAALFDLVSMGFAYPSQDLYRALTDGRYIEAAESNVALLGNPPVLVGALQALAAGLKTLSKDCNHRQLETEYNALFELSRDEVPLHLNAHLYMEGRPDPVPVYKRLQKSYREFALELNPEKATESPDHLAVELEFVAYLFDLLQLTLVGEREDSVERIQRGLAAFFEELGWVENLINALEQRSAHPFYLPLGNLLRALIRQHEVVSA
jgi:TorA maturation chaperone TorD